MTSRIRYFTICFLALTAAFGYGCSSDDGANDAAGGADAGGATSNGGARSSGGQTASVGGALGSGGTVAAGGTVTTSGGGTSGNGNPGGSAGKASAGAFGGVSTSGGGAAAGNSAAGASTGGVQQAGAGGASVVAGSAGRAGSAGAAPVLAGAAGAAGTPSVACSAMAGAAGSGETRTLQSIIVSLKGQSCYDCALANCAGVLTDFFEPDVIGSSATSVSCDNLGGIADAGPAACQSRRTLCYDSVACMLQTKCAAGAWVSTCYCGTSTNCLSGAGVNGACKTQIEAAHENTSASFIGNNFGDLTLPVAGVRANKLVECMADARTYGGPEFVGDPQCNSCFL